MQVSSVEPRIFGAVPPVLAFALGLAGIVGGFAALASGALVAGLVLLFAGVALSALALDAARRWPTSAIPRASARAAEAVGSRLGFARVSAGTWLRASREEIGLRRELRELRTQREEQLSALGTAAYEDDAERMRVLRESLLELDKGIEEREGSVAEVRGRARERVKRERASVPQTQSFAVPEVDPPPGEDGDTRQVPTAERPRV